MGEISWEIQNSLEVDNKLFKKTERKSLSLAIL